jgi:hypothetical protein
MIRFILGVFLCVVVIGLFGTQLVGCSDEVAVNRVDVRVKGDAAASAQDTLHVTDQGGIMDQRFIMDQGRFDKGTNGADKGTGAGTGTGTGTGAAKGCAKLKECCDKIDAKDFSPKSMCNQLVAAARDDFCDQGYPAYAYFCK